MPEITFLVQGSEEEPYQIHARRIGTGFRMSCSCKAGQFGMWCKHRANLLAGDASAAIDPSPDAMATLQSLVEGTDAATVAQELKDALGALDRAKKHADKLKKRFAALLDGKIE